MARIVRPVRIGLATSIACVTALTGLPPTAAVAAPPTMQAPSVEADPDLADYYTEASSTAKASGEPVVVDELTTETTQVTARPEGGYSLTSYRSPVRFETTQGWVAVDDTLRHNPDGTYSPAASPADLTFSGGGTGPMLTFATADGELSLTWPGSLPTPRIDGDTAIYPEVMPGVDLSLIASPEGYKQVLTVKTREAASNPQLSTIAMAAKVDGLAVASDSHGALSATNEAGQIVLAGPRPYQWDSSPAATGEETSTDTTGAAQVDLATVHATAADGTGAPATTQVQLTPNAAALTDPDTVFPVHIDPSLNTSKQHWMTVQSGGWNYYDDTSEPMRVGKCYNADGECSSINGVARSYFTFNVGAISDQPVTAKIFDARVFVRQIHSASCSATPVTLYSAGTFTSSTTWNGPELSALQTLSSKAGNASCGNADADIVFDNDAVDARLQYTANNDYNNVYFGLISPDESNQNYWKKFGNNPGIVVTFDFPPDPPTALGVVNQVACPGKPVYSNSAVPETYVAKADNNNPGYTDVDLVFQVSSLTAPSTYTLLRNSGQINARENVLWAWDSGSIYPSLLAEGTYALRVQSQSASPQNADLGAWSGYYPFTVDRTGPATPTIASYDYPSENWGAPANYNGGSFALTGSSDTDFFSYAIDGSGLPAITNTTCTYTTKTTDKRGGFIDATSGKATLAPGSALAAGYHSMVVRGYDAAHNPSGPSTTYSFYVAPSNPSATTTSNPHRLEAESLPVSQSAAQQALTMAGYAGPGFPHYDEPSNTLFSGGLQSHLLAPGDTVPSATPPEFTYTLPGVEEGTYALGVRLVTTWHYGILEFAVDGKPVRPSDTDPAVRVGTYSASTASKYVNLGEQHLSSGTHTVTVRLVGRDPAATTQTYTCTCGTGADTVTLNGAVGYSAGVDFFTLAKLSGAAFPTLASAYNSNGITTDADTSATAGNLTNTTTGPTSLSETALAGAGLGVGQAKTVAVPSYGNVVFTRAAPINGKDSVVALGQSIAITSRPAVTSTTAVHLLVTASCGTVPVSASNQLKLQFTLSGTGETVDTDHLLTAPIPDWRSGEPTSWASVSMTAYKAGTTTTTGTNRLFVVSAKPNPDQAGATLEAVTLPDLASSMLPSATCGAPRLNVLAMGIQ